MVTTGDGVRHLPVGEKGAGLRPVSWLGSENTPEPQRSQPSSDRPEMDATVTALNEIVSVLRELKDENRNLREQVEEANRDLTEMQFRIDTNSRSFRPMKVSGEPAGPMERTAGHPLLGVKPQR